MLPAKSLRQTSDGVLFLNLLTSVLFIAHTPLLGVFELSQNFSCTSFLIFSSYTEVLTEAAVYQAYQAGPLEVHHNPISVHLVKKGYLRHLLYTLQPFSSYSRRTIKL